MAERDNKTPSGPASRVLRHDEWEALIADALDSSLTAADSAAFARHHSECALCAQMLKETQQGREWMQYLAADPEPPAGLLKKILARTSERPEVGPSAVEPGAPAVPPSASQGWQRTTRPPAYLVARNLVRQAAQQVFEPRLMMTLAMAFFSIALTLNLTGIHLTQIRPADLQPSRLRTTLTRQYYATNEQVTKYYENLRLVYEMEARVRELRRSSETSPSPQPAPAPAANPTTRKRDGAAAPSSAVPQGKLPQPATSDAEDGVFATTLPVGYSLVPGRRPDPADTGGIQGKVVHQVFRASPSKTEDQAKRSLV